MCPENINCYFYVDCVFLDFIIYMNSLEDSDDDNDVDYVPTRIDLEHIVH